MRIIQTKELTEEQKRRITELEQICYEKDSLENHAFLSTEINYDRQIPVFFLACEGGALIGFLTVFIPTKEEAEMIAFVHPAYQRKGVFTRLDEAARKVIGENGIGRTLYCVETKSESAAHVLKRWGIARISRSEYRMKLDAGKLKPNEGAAAEQAAFSVRRVRPESVADYLDISGRAFGDESLEYAQTLMTSDTRMGYLFYKGETPIGVFVIGLETRDEPFLYGVAIAEQERGKGYGRLMMERACRLGAEYGNALRLDVDSENPTAFHLYRSIGFEITFQVDYYMR